MKENASSLHLISGVPPAMRINGNMKYTDYDKVNKQRMEELIEWFVSKENSNILSEKGSCDFTYSIEKTNRFRVNIYRQRGSYSIIIKIGSLYVQSKEMLNLPNCIYTLSNLKSGLVIINGLSSSGRTSTATFIVDQIRQTHNGHIITIENPIEFLFKHDQCIISQKEVGLDVKSFEAGLEAAVYQDADVIYISELKSVKCINKVLDIAQSGKLVIAVMNTKDVSDTLQLLMNSSDNVNSNWNRLQIANCLKGILSQKLLPTTVNSTIPAFEILLQTTAVSNLIRENKLSQIPTVIENSINLGMTTFNKSIARLFHKGIITKDTALSSVYETNDMLNKLVIER
jgi:twitching motility protein PilT